MLEGWLGHCLNKTASSRLGHVFRARRWVLLSSLDFDVLELFAFFLRVKRLPSRSDLLINWCCLLGHREWSPCSVITMPGRYYCSLLCCFDWRTVTALHFTFVSLLWYYIEGMSFSHHLHCQQKPLTLAINPPGLSWVTVCLLKKHLLPSAGHSEDSVIARSLGV